MRYRISLAPNLLTGQVIIHPLTGEPIQGADEAGLDYTQLEPELRKAVIWARVTNHPLFPKQVRITEDGYALCAKPLPTPWDLIFRDYWTAQESQENSAIGVRLEYDQSELVNEVELKPDSLKNYESIVRHHARDKYVAIHSFQTLEGIYNQLEVVGSGINLKNVVVLERVHLVAAHISGTIVIPSQRVTLVEIGKNINVAPKIVCWSQIAREHNLT